jgi:hypothetical protein
VAEHHRLRRSIHSRCELLLERIRRHGSELHGTTSRLALRRRDLGPHERLPDVQTTLEQFDVLPAQAEKLTTT